MLDIVLIQLIAAGLERICRTPGDGARAVLTAADGEQLIREITSQEPEKTSKLISSIVEHIWQSCRAVGLPAEIAEAHLAALPEIISQAYVRAADRVIFLGPDGDADAEARQRAVVEFGQRMIASSDRDLNAEGLDETVLSYLLEHFLRSLLATRQLVQALQPSLTGTISGSAETETVVKKETAAVTLAKIERADALGIPVPLLDVITVSLINLTHSVDLRQADLTAMAEEALALAETFERLTVVVPVAGDLLEPLPGLFRAGRIADCDRLLAKAEDQIVKQSIDTTAHAGGHAPSGIEIRLARARLAALDSHYTKAARHCGFAQRYVPTRENDQLWNLVRQEAYYYQLAAFRGEDRQGLEQAARSCTSVLAAMAEAQPSLARAGAQVRLGHVLILLGEREQGVGRFELAGQLLADAVRYLDEAPQKAGLRARAIVLRATALVRMGELLGDGALVEQGAHMYQEVIEGPDAALLNEFEDEELFEPMAGLRPRLALAMISYAALTEVTGLYEPAINNIEAELPGFSGDDVAYDQSGFDRFVLLARCHQVLAERYSANGDEAAAENSRAEMTRLCAATGMSGLLALAPAVPPQVNYVAATT